ncbi:MAG: hypothetical protein ACLGH1_04280 [Gammaproteobacteria bacterium]
MLELLAGFVALAAILAISYCRGRSKKRDALSMALSSPGEVARIYLREAPEIEACWLHVQFRNGRKRVLAAPWEVDETLRQLDGCGIRLGEEDAALLAARKAAAGVSARPARTSPGPRANRASGKPAGAGT